jgi:hypothetical protein
VTVTPSRPVASTVWSGGSFRVGGVLGVLPGVLGVLGVLPGVLGALPGVLGVAPGVLDEAPGVLGVAPGLGFPVPVSGSLLNQGRWWVWVPE